MAGKAVYKKRRKRSVWSRMTPLGRGLILVSLGVLLVCVAALVINTIRVNNENQPETVYMTQGATEATTEAPTKNYVGNKNVVCIDPGHGGADGGAVANGLVEKDNTLMISLLVRDYLQSQGITVIMTRETDVAVTKEKRCEIANATDACLFVSIHRNNHIQDASARGIEAWIEKSGNQQDYKISNMILDELNGLFGGVNRGVYIGSTGEETVNYYVNGHTNMNSTLIELGFMSNAADNDVVMNKRSECAKAIGDGILKYLATLE